MSTYHKCDIISIGHDDLFFEKDFQEENMEKTLSEISLYDLMADDLSVWVNRNKKFGFDLEIRDDESTYAKCSEIGINPCAIEGLAEFCRRFLHSYSKFENEGIYDY